MQRRTVPSILRAPLLHFLLLGAALFALHAWLNGRDVFAPDTIVIERGQVEHLAAGFERLRHRPPMPDELQGLIDEAVREEIFYREAIAQGLDRNDVIVRRRLMQKLEFMVEDLEPIPEPTDAQLRAWLDSHPLEFALAPRYTFEQVYVDPTKHGARLEEDTRALLEKLRGGTANSGTLGDPFLLARRMDDAPTDEVERQFGARFAGSLDTLPVGAWQGPVPSGYGVHLVRLVRREAGRAPALADVRETVRREWLHAQRQAANARWYADLRKRYEVRVELPAPAARDATTSMAELQP